MLVLILTVNFSGSTSASTGGNTGLTGLWEYPNAEMPEDGTGRFGFTYDSPYNFYFIDLAWLPWLEINARLSTFETVITHDRRYMDKAIDLKFMLWHSKSPTNWIIPSIAVGVVDMMGTELMKAYYGAATWRSGKFAATIGYGSDRLNGFYGGFEWDIADWLTFKAEYSPLDYTRDRAGGKRVLDKLPSQKYNAGLVFKTPWGMQGSVSYQRGDEWAFTISQRINLSGPFIGNAPRRYGTPGNSRAVSWDDIESQDLILRIKSGLNKYVRVRDVEIKLEDSEENGHRLLMSYENYGYASHAEAMTRVLVLLSAVMPETDGVVLIAKDAGIPIVKAEFPGLLLFDIRARSLRDEENIIHSAVFSWADSDIKDPDAEVLASKARHEVKAMLVYEPRIDQTLDDDYMDRLNIDAIYKGRYSNGWQAIADIRFPIYNNVDTRDSDGIWWEKDLNSKIRLQQAALTYANRIGNNPRAWIFGEGGYLNEEWFGANLWARYYGSSGLWWIGARLAALHDRDPYTFAGLTRGKWFYRNGSASDEEDKDAWRYAEWLQAGLHIADLNLDLQADYGKFADEDKGWKLSATRHWDDTAVGFWYINTDIHAPGKDFTTAGVHMELPADKWFGSWFGNSSSHIWEQDTILLSSWHVQTGREGGMVRTPERFMSQLRPVPLKKNVEKLLRDYCTFDDTGNEGDKNVTGILGYIFH
ncbi:MAG: YjbH domain-containing protein [Synergistaceae bacterium]|nr:YjbH domain-containing protein [Synergistaceae bacterium]